MDQLDIFYRAYSEYKKAVEGNRDARRAIDAVVKGMKQGGIEIEHAECEIESDWIEAIETGLSSVGKAIAQERQFIQSNGEILPIEKVKSVSRESVSHLSRHSNLIKKITDGNIIPEKLYTVERQSDFAIYENRFLYYLLTLLQQFLSYRLNRILEQVGKYKGDLNIKIDQDTAERKLNFELKMREELYNDQMLIDVSPQKDKITTIKGLLSAVLVYMSMPLMEEAAKAPMIKPPITETNVLRMDKDFKGALDLYHYITAYDKDGFIITPQKQTISPFIGNVARDMTLTASFPSFLTYMFGLGIEENLREWYEQQELNRQSRAEKELEERLENRVKNILGISHDQVDAAQFELKKANMRIEELTKSLLDYEQILQRQRDEQIEKAEKMQAEFEQRYENTCNQFQQQVDNLTKQRDSQREGYEAQIAELQNTLAAEREAFRQQYAALCLEEQGKTERALQEASEMRTIAASAQKEAKDLRKQNRLVTARYNAMRFEQGLTEEEDFTSQEAFDELEHQYNTFKSFFKEEWKKSKRRIRRETFGWIFGGKKAEQTQQGADAASEGSAEPADATKRKGGIKGFFKNAVDKCVHNKLVGKIFKNKKGERDASNEGTDVPSGAEEEDDTQAAQAEAQAEINADETTEERSKQ